MKSIEEEKGEKKLVSTPAQNDDTAATAIVTPPSLCHSLLPTEEKRKE
jgi:hypothetical protein